MKDDKKKKILVAMQVTLIAFLVFTLSSCEWGNEIVSVEIYQLPYKMIYIAGIDNSLDMEGCIVRKHIRNGEIDDSLFGDWPFVVVEHEIDFLLPGEYEVFFYWGSERGKDQIGSMVIQVIESN